MTESVAVFARRLCNTGQNGIQPSVRAYPQVTPEVLENTVCGTLSYDNFIGSYVRGR